MRIPLHHFINSENKYLHDEEASFSYFIHLYPPVFCSPLSVKSPVDNRSLEGIESIRIQNTTDFQGHNKIIRWTEVFFIKNGISGDSMSKRHIPEPVDLSRLAENLAIAFCLALSESLQDLNTLGLNKLGLRVTVDLEQVSYVCLFANPTLS